MSVPENKPRKITDKLIADEIPREKSFEICDSDIKGYCLVVWPSGVKSFCYRYRNADGAKRTYTIGKYGTVTAAKARNIAERKAAEVRIGIDIQAEKKAGRVRAENARLQTLKVFFDDRYKPFLETNRKSGVQMAQVIERNFVTKWGDKSLVSINAWLFEQWRSEKLKRGLKKSSTNRLLAYLKALMQHAVVWGVIEVNPLAMVKQFKEDTRATVRYLSGEEEAQLLAALETRQDEHKAERLRYIDWCKQRKHATPEPFRARYTDYLMPLVVLALHTGMRRGELFNLQWGDVNFPKRVLSIHGSGAKSDLTRHVHLNDVAFSALVAWANQTDSARTNLVFPSPTTGKRFDNIATAWGNLMKVSKIKQFRFHDLRHTFASKLVMRGTDLYTVKELLGHASIEMTQRYAHLSPDHKAAAVALLNSN